MSKLSDLGRALYDGTVSIDFVGRKWLWYSISGADRAGRGERARVPRAQPRHRVPGRRRVPGLGAEGQATEATVVEIRKAVAQEAADADIPAAGVADRQHVRRRTASGCRPSR